MVKSSIKYGIVPIKGFDDYTISEDGRIFSCKNNKFRELKTHIIRVGGQGRKKKTQYYQVGLVRNGKQIHERIGVLLLTSFVCSRLEGTYCCHLNGNTLDDNLDNLAWKSMSYIIVRRFKVGEHHFQKLIASDVCDIKERLLGGESVTKIAASFDVSSSTISSIKSERTWSDIC